jgi:hypothetical protein
MPGRTLKETAVDLGLTRPHLGTSSGTKSRAVMRIVLTFVVLGAAVWLIYIDKHDSQTLAAGFIGTVIGYWFN